jgi:hypothetical protein
MALMLEHCVAVLPCLLAKATEISSVPLSTPLVGLYVLPSASVVVQRQLRTERRHWG